MSPVKPQQTNPSCLYFVTTSAVNHFPFFESDIIKQILLDSLNHLRISKWIQLYAFVIMPNHIHLILRLCGVKSLADVIRDFKKYTARMVFQHFEVFEDVNNLLRMNKAIENTQQLYKIWEDGYDAREIFSSGFLGQKLDYIHSNPCRSNWNLVETPEEYAWSSARLYLLDKPALIDLDDVRELL